MRRGGRKAARPRRRRIAAGSAAFLVALILAELLVRGWAYHLREEFEQYDYATGVYRLVPGIHSSGSGGVIAINADGFRGPELAPQAPSLFRMVTMGDSCTFGAGSGRRSYPVLLQEFLSARGSTRIHAEIVNAAISGSDSEGALRRLMTKVLPLQPDVVAIYIGWNDLMKYSPRAQMGVGLTSRLARSVDRLWVVRAIRKAMFFHVRPAVVSPEVGPESRTGRFRDFQPVAFERNLREMTAAIRAAGAQPVLVTLPTALHESMSEDRLRERQIIFPYFSGSDRVGDFLDLIAAYNRAIRRVAVEADAPVVDLARSFATLPDPALYFWDTMHPNEDGQLRVARLFERAIDRARLLKP